MSSPSKETEEPPSSSTAVANGEPDEGSGGGDGEGPRPPAKRPASTAVIEISDTDSDDSDICAVSSYQASADEVKRIRGEDYSSASSSSSDYSSDSESAADDDSILVDSEPPQTKLIRAQLNPRANRMDDPKFNPKIKSQELIDRIKTHWTEHKDLSLPEVSITSEPFRLGLLHGLLDNPEIINNIVDDMNTLDWSRKKMDLYEFHQTADLASLTWQRSIRGIYELLKTEVMSWMSAVTGLELSSVSASCSLYGPGDHLLVHDDLLGSRRVAFILYLAPWRTAQRRHNGDSAPHVDLAEEGWSAHMGGALELVARDEEGRPTDVARAVTPVNNMLAFFQVGPETFHQVGEVLSLELPRLSINGWFHGPAAEPAPAPPRRRRRRPKHSARTMSPYVVMQALLEPTYMSPRARAAVQAQMERQSEACLRDLLQSGFYCRLLEALRSPAWDHSCSVGGHLPIAVGHDKTTEEKVFEHIREAARDVPWERAGPGDQRRHSALPAAWSAALPKDHPVRELLKMVSGVGWLRLLHDCTDLTLTALTPPSLQRWRAGDFTLLPPREHYQEPRLELVLYLGLPARRVCGGATSYVAPEEVGQQPDTYNVPGAARAARLRRRHQLRGARGGRPTARHLQCTWGCPRGASAAAPPATWRPRR
ncbi:hypothetical protein MSG28_009077 [Choristoneura fumiferana]|uniref:Uncharacterized protein n=1 Tax=Choristoneura fumiferana TaxID=7141 RepID=A0ACC0KWQ5_CHOFU|nr:hypothetical protein MSG28_009077 [Choristoneura fumiferana]